MLTVEEQTEKKKTLDKIKGYGVESLTQHEIERLKYILQKDEGEDEGLKLLILLGLGALLGYALAKSG